MQYVGGKSKIGRRIVNAILADTDNRVNWFEPFVGGAGVLEHAAPHFKRSVAMDAHPDLIMMWQAVQSGHNPPALVPRQRYESLRKEQPSALRGWAGFALSYGGKWFAGYSGDAIVGPRDRKYVLGEVVHRSMTKQAERLRSADIIFRHGAFGCLQPPPGTVVYCDPPYVGTTGYSVGSFDHAGFYRTCRQWAASGCDVYVSEYQIPDTVPHRLLWSTEKAVMLDVATNSRKATEKLYKITGE